MLRAMLEGILRIHDELKYSYIVPVRRMGREAQLRHSLPRERSKASGHETQTDTCHSRMSVLLKM